MKRTLANAAKHHKIPYATLKGAVGRWLKGKPSGLPAEKDEATGRAWLVEDNDVVAWNENELLHIPGVATGKRHREATEQSRTEC